MASPADHPRHFVDECPICEHPVDAHSDVPHTGCTMAVWWGLSEADPVNDEARLVRDGQWVAVLCVCQVAHWQMVSTEGNPGGISL